jgi:LuxR family maltose regulon positive regulatory protein
LIEHLNEGLAAGCRLALISAPAGFGKTSLVSEWIAACGRPAAWLSLDEAENDPARLYELIAALQTIRPVGRFVGSAAIPADTANRIDINLLD